MNGPIKPQGTAIVGLPGSVTATSPGGASPADVHRNAEETAVLESKRFTHSALDALSAHIAILDEHGTILEVNAAWRRFADENGFSGSHHGLGANYLRICDLACDGFSGGGPAVARGIRAIITGESLEFHLEYPCRSINEQLWFIVRITRFAVDGAVRVVVAHENITERKRAEEALQGSEERLHLALEAGRLGIFEHFMSDSRLRVSPEFCLIFELPAQAFFSLEEWSGRIHPDDRTRVLEGTERFLRGETVFECEYRLLLPMNNVRWIHVRESRTVEAGKTDRVHGVVEDISERMRTEAELRKLSSAVEQSPSSIVITDVRGSIEYVNPKFCALTGYSAEEMLGTNPRLLKTGDASDETYPRLWATITAGGVWRGAFHNRKKNGETFWESASIAPIRDDKGNVTHFVGVKEDITERKRVEEDLRWKSAFLEAQVNSSIDGILVVNPDGQKILQNQRVAELFNIPLHIVEDKSDQRQFEWVARVLENPQAFIEKIAHLYAHPNEISRDEIKLIDGRMLDRYSAPVVGLDGESYGRLWTFRDVTERKKSNESLYRQQAELRALFDLMPAMIWFKDTENRILRVNQRVAENARKSIEEIEGKPSVEIYPLDADRFYADDLEVIRSGAPKLGYVEGLRDGAGKEFWVQTDKVPYFDQDGKVVGVVVMAQDVTERKQTEETLQRQKNELRVLFDFLPAIICFKDTENRILRANKRLAETMGKTVEEIEGRSAVEIYQQDAAKFYEDDLEVIRSGVPKLGIIETFKDRCGEERWIQTDKVPVRGKDEAVTGLVVMAQDITDRKRAESLVRQSEDRYRSIFDNARDAIFTLALDGRFTSMNPAVEAIGGLVRSEWINRPFGAMVHPEDRLRASEMFQCILRGEQAPIHELRGNPDVLEEVTMEMTITAQKDESGRTIGVLGIGRDITERKRTEEAVKERLALRERLAKIAASVTGLIYSFRLRPDGSVCMPYVSPGFEELYGIKADGVATDASCVFDITHPEDQAQVRHYIAESARTLSPLRTEFRVQHSQKGLVWVESQSTPERESDGGTLWYGFASDVSARKRADEALRESEEKFRQLADNISDAFWICSPDFKTMHFISAGYALIWGRRLESLYANPHQWSETIIPEDRERVGRIFSQLMEAQSQVSVEYRIARPDGSIRWIQDRGFQIRDTAGTVIRLAGIASDITERKRTTEQLADHKEREERSGRALEHERELQKVKSRFVSIVSHEFRTPLGIINTAAHLLGRYAERMSDEERSGQLEEIQNAVARMTEMMEDLLVHGNFQGGATECSPARLDLEALCRKLIAEAANRRGAPHAITFTIEPAARETILDEKILRHVLGNLLSNAVKYSLDGQPVTLEVKRIAGAPLRVDDPTMLPGDHILLKVSDTGIGIPSADLAKLFQTFHRAANVANRPGTGMGLAIVKQFVDLHRGTIRFESVEGKGTSVWVRLPIASLNPEASPPAVGKKEAAGEVGKKSEDGSARI